MGRKAAYGCLMCSSRWRHAAWRTEAGQATRAGADPGTHPTVMRTGDLTGTWGEVSVQQGGVVIPYLGKVTMDSAGA